MWEFLCLPLGLAVTLTKNIKPPFGVSTAKKARYARLCHRPQGMLIISVLWPGDLCPPRTYAEF